MNDLKPKAGSVRCVFCGEFMRKCASAPRGYACSRMVYSHAYMVWEHE